MADLTTFRVKQVVLIDDDGDQLALCRRALARESAGSVTVSAYSEPVVALQALAAAPAPDLIVVDMHMAPTSGPTLVARLRGCPQLAQVTILMLSSSDRASDLSAARAAGANGYLLKPQGAAGWPAVAAALLGGWREIDLFRPATP